MLEEFKKKLKQNKIDSEYGELLTARLEMGEDYINDSPMQNPEQEQSREQLDEYGEMLMARLEMEDQFIEDVNTLDEESDAEQLEKKKRGFLDLFAFVRRWRRLNDDQEEKENKDKVDRMSEVLKKGLQGAMAGFSIGQVMDEVLPREQLDAMTELREDYIRMYGDEKVYKEVKSDMYKKVRELNKELKVSAFGGEDISEGLRQALLANVPEDMASSFALSAAKLKKVGADLGDSTAKAFSMGFKKNSVEVMDSLANVLATAKINEQVKTSITEMVAEVSKDISAMGLSPEQQKESATNLAATLSQLESSNIMTVQQSEQIRDMILKASRGDVSTIENLAKMGVSSGSVSKAVKGGDWASAYEQVLRGIANSPLHSEVLKAMELDIDEDQIALLKSSKTEINSLSEKSNEIVKQSKVEVDGLSQAEIRARDISKTSWVERFKNWTGTTRLIEGASDVLEKLNIDASTASSVIGGLAGAGKGLFDTFLMMKMAGVPLPGVIAKLIPMLGGLGASLAGVSAAALPILGVVAATAALIGAGYMLYKHWDKVTKWFGKATSWIKDKVDGFKNSISNFVKELPGVSKIMDWFGSDEEKDKKVMEDVKTSTTKNITDTNTNNVKIDNIKTVEEAKSKIKSVDKNVDLKTEGSGEMGTNIVTPEGAPIPSESEGVDKGLDTGIGIPKVEDMKTSEAIEVESPSLKQATNQQVEVIEPVVSTKSKDDISSNINNVLASAGLKTGTEKTNTLLDLLVRIAANMDKKIPNPSGFDNLVLK